MHAIPIADVPPEFTAESWVGREPASIGERPPILDPVLVHGDACAPNTLISLDGAWTGNVDFGDLAVGDRWADLAVASMSLDWNFGEGHQPEFFAAYGIEPDEAADPLLPGAVGPGVLIAPGVVRARNPLTPGIAASHPYRTSVG